MNKTDMPLSLSWLTAIEHYSRDTMGVLARDFLRGVYMKTAEQWLATQSSTQGQEIRRADTPVQAIAQYVASSATGGLLKAQEDIEIKEQDDRIHLIVHRCPYKSVCQSLVDTGLRTNELTCPRLGCLVGAVRILAEKNATHELEEFQSHGYCRGYIKVEENL